MAGRMQMREAEVERMIQLLRRAANEFRDVGQQMQQAARAVDDGALLGQGGMMLAQALGQTLTGAIERLAQKMEERANFVEREKEQLKRAMGESGGLYG